MSEQTEYAFGTDCMSDTSCPASAAGYLPRTDSLAREVASRYDVNIRSWVHPDEDMGVVDEETAREHWLEAVHDCEQLGYEVEANVGKNIADELGWL